MIDLSRCYEILEIKPGASKEEVRRAYRDLAQVWHPDRFEGRPGLRSKAEARLKEINDAYRQLSLSGQGQDGGIGGSTGGGRLTPVRRWWIRIPTRSWELISLVGRRGPRLGAVLLLATGVGIVVVKAVGNRGFVARDGQPIRFVEISAGAWHACGIDPSGGVYCWGVDDAHQLGNGEGTDVCDGATTLPCSLTPRHVKAPQSFESVISGWSHTCALDENGVSYCWGAGFAGQTGLGHTEDVAEPTLVSGPLFRSITTLGQHTCGLAEEGNVYCWGSDESGQLGDTGHTQTCISDSGPFPCAQTPRAVEPQRTWRAVSAGANHTCALTKKGRALCWGSNRSGQVGSPGGDRCGRPGSEHPCRRVPHLVDFDGTFQHISAGAAHSCALASSGTAWCWGDNRYGQLGNATVQSASTPVQVVGNQVFESIEARGHQTCAVGGDGRTFCWGRVPAGIGVATRICAGVPCALVPTAARIPAGAKVTAGIEFACVLAVRTQRCWGRNDVGQLGNGTVAAPLRNRALTNGADSPRLVIPGPFRRIRNFVNAAVWGLRRFVGRLLAPILSELDGI